jgi:hypothetical protein
VGDKDWRGVKRSAGFLESSAWELMLVGSAVSMHDTVWDNTYGVLVDLGQKYMIDCWLGVFAVCTYNASISVHTLVSAHSSDESPMMSSHTFRHIFGLFNALANLAFVLYVGFGWEGFVEAWTEVVVAKWVFTAHVEEFWWNAVRSCSLCL